MNAQPYTSENLYFIAIIAKAFERPDIAEALSKAFRRIKRDNPVRGRGRIGKKEKPLCPQSLLIVCFFKALAIIVIGLPVLILLIPGMLDNNIWFIIWGVLCVCLILLAIIFIIYLNGDCGMIIYKPVSKKSRAVQVHYSTADKRNCLVILFRSIVILSPSFKSFRRIVPISSIVILSTLTSFIFNILSPFLMPNR